MASCCFHSRNDCLSPPLLPQFSLDSSLLWDDPTSGRPSGSLHLQDFNPLYCLRRDVQTSQVRLHSFVRSPRSYWTPAESPRTRISPDSCCLRLRRKYRLPHYMTYGAESLHAFALRLSHSNCLRLNPASRPRLQGCVPVARYGFTGFGLSPNCLTSAELAHPLFLLYYKGICSLHGQVLF